MPFNCTAITTAGLPPLLYPLFTEQCLQVDSVYLANVYADAFAGCSMLWVA